MTKYHGRSTMVRYCRWVNFIDLNITKVLKDSRFASKMLAIQGKINIVLTKAVKISCIDIRDFKFDLISVLINCSV